MTRLDSVIRRLQAQRVCLDWAARQLTKNPPLDGKRGVVFELGLGNGRTFDHLRKSLPEHDIYVFDNQVAAHPDCVPDQHRLYLGDIRQTLPNAVADHACCCVLVHSDISSGVVANNLAIAEFLSVALIPALAPGCLLVSDQPLDIAGSETLALPPGVAADRYYIRRFSG